MPDLGRSYDQSSSANSENTERKTNTVNLAHTIWQVTKEKVFLSFTFFFSFSVTDEAASVILSPLFAANTISNF